MTTPFALVPVAYVVMLREGPGGTEVLLQLRQNTGYRDGHWGVGAAGHVEAGETAYDAAHREAREEIGVEGLDLEFLTTMQRTGASGLAIDERIDFFFLARTWTGEPRILEPERCAALRWWPLSDLGGLPDPVVPHELVVLDSIASGTTPAYSPFGFSERTSGGLR